MLAGILLLIARATRTNRTSMRDQCEQIRRAATGKVWLDLGEAARFHVPLPSTTRIDRLLQLLGVNYLLSKPLKGAILASNLPGIWRMSAQAASRRTCAKSIEMRPMRRMVVSASGLDVLSSYLAMAGKLMP